MGRFFSFLVVSGLSFLLPFLSVAQLITTTEYYDNRHAVVVFSADDWYGCKDYHEGFMKACDSAQQNNVVFSPGIVPLGSNFYWYTCRAECPEACSPEPDIDPPTALRNWQWAEIQAQIDEGFVSPVSHSLSHPTIPYDDYEMQIVNSRKRIIDNLTLPRQNQYNGLEYIVGWIEPYGVINNEVRSWLSQSGYLADRGIFSGVSRWALWQTDGLYESQGVTINADNNDLTTLNNTFDHVYATNGIYHVFLHPRFHDWGNRDKIPLHLSYIGNRTDIWYIGWGQLYMYHYLQDQIGPEIEILTYNDESIIFRVAVPADERNKYGLSYPITYLVTVPEQWRNVTVYNKNVLKGRYVLMAEKTSNDFFNGINAFRKNLLNHEVYISKGFPQVSNEFWIKIESKNQNVNFNKSVLQSYGVNQDQNPVVALDTIHIIGNGWKKMEFAYTISPVTILEFDFKCNAEGEIHGIGFDDDDRINNPIRIFQLFGTQSWGIPDFEDYQDTAPNWKHYRIPVGQFYTGDMMYLTFINDHDAEPQDGESLFSNIRVYD